MGFQPQHRTRTRRHRTHDGYGSALPVYPWYGCTVVHGFPGANTVPVPELPVAPKPRVYPYPCYSLSPSPHTYLVSTLVCCRFEYITFPFPFHSNDAVILPVSKMDLTTLFLATLTSRAASTALIASSPQHDFACFCKFPVELASPLSKNQRHLYLQDFPMQEKMWQHRPSTYMYAISGVAV